MLDKYPINRGIFRFQGAKVEFCDEFSVVFEKIGVKGLFTRLKAINVRLSADNYYLYNFHISCYTEPIGSGGQA